MTNPTATAKALGELAGEPRKPILAAWLGGRSMREGIRILNEAGIATYATPEQAVRAFMTLVAYARNLEILYETPRDIPVEFPLDRARAAARASRRCLPPGGDTLSEAASKAAARGLRHPGHATARRATAAEEAARGAHGDRLPGGAEGPLPRHHAQDRRGRRGPRPARRRRGARGLRPDRGRGATGKPGGAASTASPCSRWCAPADGVRADRRRQEGPGLRHGDPGRPGRHRGRGVRATAPSALPPLNERLARRMLESLRVVAAAAGLPRPRRRSTSTG